MEKETILQKCLKLLKRKKDFDSEAKKFKKGYPESYIHGHFEERIKGKVFYHNEEFYIPNRIIIEKGRKEDVSIPFIECEKLSIFSWSASSMNKVKDSEFRYFKEVTKEDIRSLCSKLLMKYSKGILELEKNVLEKLKRGEGNSSTG